MLAATRVIVFVIGVVIVALTFGSAVRTVILPRGIPSRLGRVVFLAMRSLFELRSGRSADYERHDRVLALYAPLSLLALLVSWLLLTGGGFTLMFWALEGVSLGDALILSGASITTLGNALPPSMPAYIVSFVEAIGGLVLLAMLLTYLPSLYSAFSRREAVVTALEVRAGAPPTGVEMIRRLWVLGRIDLLSGIWTTWETWFVELEETHTSFPALVFFRSPQPDHSWVTAAGAVLDAASLRAAAVDAERDVQAEICIRAGYLALRRIAAFFAIPFDPDPAPDDPISITRAEFDAAIGDLASAGVPIVGDRERAWHDFAGWRVNYDAVLLTLSTLITAPPTPWSSDRGPARRHRPPIVPVRRGPNRRRG
jgi:hypothetical protein